VEIGAAWFNCRRSNGYDFLSVRIDLLLLPASGWNIERGCDALLPVARVYALLWL
jgi:uncharacterized protein (DUF736 family)